MIATLREPLLEMYMDDENQSKSTCGLTKLNVQTILASKMWDLNMLIAQLDTLRNKLLSCTQIASSFSELSNGQSLQQLALSAAKESKQAAADAAAVKGLTIIAAIFLPTTVVLNFFSASFIETRDHSFALVGRWWLFAAVAAPLTVVTIALWAIWMQYQKRSSSESMV